MTTSADTKIVVDLNTHQPLPVKVEKDSPDRAMKDADAFRSDLKEEWKECRDTMGRFDSILVDLRKFGFSFVTTLLTASALFGIAGTSTPKPDAVVLAFVIIMALNAILFTVDTYYTSLLNGAAERALDLEAQLKSYRISKYLSDNAKHVKSVTVTLFLYLSLQLLIIGLAGWVVFRGIAGTRPTMDIVFWVLSGGASAISLLWMIGYWLYASCNTNLLTENPERRWESPSQGEVGRKYQSDGVEQVDLIPLDKMPKNPRRIVASRLSGCWRVKNFHCVRRYKMPSESKIKIERSILTETPVEKVFAYATDPMHLPEVEVGITEVYDVNLSANTCTYIGTMFNRRVEGTATITTKTDPNQLTSKHQLTSKMPGTDGEMKMELDSTFTSEEGGKTRVSFTHEYTLPAAVLDRLGEPRYARYLDYDVESLRAKLQAKLKALM